MGSKSKTVGLLLVLIFIMSLVTIQPLNVSAQSNSQNSPPTIEWQNSYSNNKSGFIGGFQSASNVIQTADGGYAFMDLGWSHQVFFVPSTVYKLNSTGFVEWKKTIDYLDAKTIIQTNDGGFEIAGWWSTYGTTYQFTPTLIKTDSQANIQYVENYSSQWIENPSSVPNLGVTYPVWEHGGSYSTVGSIKTSDGGFAHWSLGNITKTDDYNITQWVENMTYVSDGGVTPLGLTSVVETSDGALVSLGIGYYSISNSLTGKIYLTKTEPFLPVPSPTQLPTPIQTPTATTSTPKNTSQLVSMILPITLIAIVLAVVISLLFYGRHQKYSPAHLSF
jgi:hypothetical protein